jgi:pyrophosphatase PpaX
LYPDLSGLELRYLFLDGARNNLEFILKKKYSAFLFDADGTLIDTTEMIYKCFVHTLTRFSGPQPGRDEIVSSIGLPLYEQFEKYFGKLEKPRADEIARSHMEYQLSIADQYLRPFPSIAEGLSMLERNHCRLAVVTSRRMDTLTLYLEKTGLLRYFKVLITPESTTRHKPHPAPAFKALELLGCTAKDALFIGDSSYDIECGSEAGIDTAFVQWSHTSETCLKIRPTMIIRDLRELAQLCIDTPAPQR